MRFSYLAQTMITGLMLLGIACSSIPQERQVGIWDPRKMLVGTWKGTDFIGETGTMTFRDDGTLSLIFQDLILDDKSIDGEVRWRLNAEHCPMQLDIYAFSSSGEAKLTIWLIVHFVSNDTIQVRIGDDPLDRPVGFSEDDSMNQLLLHRQPDPPEVAITHGEIQNET